MIDTKAIRAVAEPVHTDVFRVEREFGDMYQFLGPANYFYGRIRGKKRADFIATVNPTTVLTMCDEIERLRTALEQPAVEPVAALRRVMYRLADLLDEDQFAEMENIVLGAGVAPLTQQPAMEPVGGLDDATRIGWAMWRIKDLEQQLTAQQPEQNQSAYQRGYMDGTAKPCPDCADYKRMYLKVRDELAEAQQRLDTCGALKFPVRKPCGTQPAVEPFGYYFHDDPEKFATPGSGFRRGSVPPKDTSLCLALYTAPQAQQPAVEPEPVGEIVACNDYGYPWKRIEYRYPSDIADLPIGTKVYTAPQAQQPAPEINQCDGCRSGQEMRGSLHVDRDGKATMVCQASKYEAPVQEPTEREAPCARHCEAQAFKIEQRQLVRQIVDYMEIIAKQRVVMTRAWEVLGSMDVGTTSRTLGARVALREVLDMPAPVQQPRKAVKLTDDEIDKLQYEYVGVTKWFPNLVRQIEQAVLKANGVE